MSMEICWIPLPSTLRRRWDGSIPTTLCCPMHRAYNIYTLQGSKHIQKYTLKPGNPGIPIAKTFPNPRIPNRSCLDLETFWCLTRDQRFFIIYLSIWSLSYTLYNDIQFAKSPCPIFSISRCSFACCLYLKFFNSCLI